MSNAGTIARNTFFLTASNVFQKLISFVLVVLIARAIPVGDFGIYSFLFSFSLIVSVFSDLGITTVIERYLMKGFEKNLDYFFRGFGLKLLLFFSVFICFLAFAFFSGEKGRIVFLLPIALASLLFDSLAGYFQIVFSSRQKMENILYVHFVYKIFFALALLAAIFYSGGLELVIFAHLFASLFFCLFSYIRSSQIIYSKIALFFPQFNFSFFKKIIVEALPFTFLSIIFVVYSKADSILILFFLGSVSTGYYSAAYRLIESLSFISLAFTNAVYPSMCKFYSEGSGLSFILYSKTIKVLFVLGLPMAVGVILLSGRLIVFFFEQNYSPAAGALSILVIYAMLNYLTRGIYLQMISLKKEKKATFITFLAVALNVILNLFLIPAIGIEGAAVSIALSEFFYLAVLNHSASKMGFKVDFARLAAKPLVSSAAMALFIYFFNSLNLFALIFLSAGIYFAVLFLIKGFDKTELDFLYGVWNKFKKRSILKK